MLHGIALQGKRAYFVTVKDVFAADVQPDGTFTKSLPFEIGGSGQPGKIQLTLRIERIELGETAEIVSLHDHVAAAS